MTKSEREIYFKDVKIKGSWRMSICWTNHLSSQVIISSYNDTNGELLGVCLHPDAYKENSALAGTHVAKCVWQTTIDWISFGYQFLSPPLSSGSMIRFKQIIKQFDWNIAEMLSSNIRYYGSIAATCQLWIDMVRNGIIELFILANYKPTDRDTYQSKMFTRLMTHIIYSANDNGSISDAFDTLLTFGHDFGKIGSDYVTKQIDELLVLELGGMYSVQNVDEKFSYVDRLIDEGANIKTPNIDDKYKQLFKYKVFYLQQFKAHVQMELSTLVVSRDLRLVIGSYIPWFNKV